MVPWVAGTSQVAGLREATRPISQGATQNLRFGARFEDFFRGIQPPLLAMFSFLVTNEQVIRSFANEATEKIFRGEKLTRKEEKQLGGLRIGKAQERLAILNQSAEKDLLTLRSLFYHKLHGEDRYSIDADARNSKWRISFAWADEELTDVKLVEIEDTHS